MTTEVTLTTQTPPNAGVTETTQYSKSDKATMDAITAVLNALYGTKKTSAEYANAKIREEQLLAALTYRELKKKSPKLAEEFLKKLPRERLRQKADNEKAYLFKATDALLREFKVKGKINDKEFAKIEKFALGKSDLDEKVTKFDPEKKQLSNSTDSAQAKSNIEAILDQIHGNKAATETELKKLKKNVKGKRPKQKPKKSPPKTEPPKAGTPPKPEGPSETDRPGEAPSAPKAESGPNDFFFKPISEKDGNALIQLPVLYSKEVTELSIYSESGEVLAGFKFAGYGDDGRAYWRLDRSGTDLGENLTVYAKLEDGTYIEFATITNSKENYKQEFSAP